MSPVREPHYADDAVTLYHGDCLDVLRELPDASVDAVVTDPPYGLEFMGKEWDGANGFRRSLNAADAGRDNAFGRTSRTSPEYRATPEFQAWCELWAAECLRVLKPGGHMLAFGGTRTWHRLAVAIEDAGFEVRDSIAWLYGSGFPKSLDVSKAIDKAAGAEREVVGTKLGQPGYSATQGNGDHRTYGTGLGNTSDGVKEAEITAPATPDAQKWAGWGTALKPAHEPVVVARKPLTGTVSQNVLAHGTGALNIDACRIAGPPSGLKPYTRNTVPPESQAANHEHVTFTDHAAGRWPANVVLDPAAAEELDRQVPNASVNAAATWRSAADTSGGYGNESGIGKREAGQVRIGFGDTGGASRFFYVPKAGSNERPRDGATAHPTVKPLDLMRWLVRLVTPPGGVVLEPFAGSGTTAEACVIEGFRCIAIEREADYLPLIVQRLSKPIEPVMF